MTITNNVTVYKCEHCNKKMFRKHAMIRHEKLCRSNPDNYRICFECSNLTGVRYPVIVDTEFVDKELVMFKGFKCTKLDCMLYTYKAEKMEIHKKYDNFKNQKPMLKECEYFQGYSMFNK